MRNCQYQVEVSEWVKGLLDIEGIGLRLGVDDLKVKGRNWTFRTSEARLSIEALTGQRQI